MYSSRQEALIKPLLDKFTEETGVQVNLVTGKGDALLTRIKSEGQFSPADLVLVADAGRLVRAEQMGLTQAMSVTSFPSNLDSSFIDADKQWVALTKRARPIMFKKGSFDSSSIATFDDLASASLGKNICVRSSSNIYNQSMVSALIELKGYDATLAWAKGVVKNMARTPKGGDRDQIKALVAGECQVAIANTYYLGGMLASKDKTTREIAEQVGVIWPDQQKEQIGAHVNISGAALLKHAKNKALAEQLVAFMLAPDSQQWYAQVNHEYPVIDEIALSPQLETLGTFKSQNVSFEEVGKNNAKALMLMDQAGWK